MGLAGYKNSANGDISNMRRTSRRKINGAAKWILVALAMSGVIWNAAILHNDVKHLKDSQKAIEQELKEIKDAIFVAEWQRNPNPSSIVESSPVRESDGYNPP